MALFQNVKRVTEYVEPVPTFPHSNKKHEKQIIYIQKPAKPARWMKKLDLLCHNDSVHPLPVKMVHIGTIPDASVSGGFRYIYACPYGRGSANACQMREYWVLKNNKKPKRVWRGIYNRR